MRRFVNVTLMILGAAALMTACGDKYHVLPSFDSGHADPLPHQVCSPVTVHHTCGTEQELRSDARCPNGTLTQNMSLLDPCGQGRFRTMILECCRSLAARPPLTPRPVRATWCGW